MSLETLIEISLSELDIFLKHNDWFGRENEVVNLYCHRFLLGSNTDTKVTPGQCGIEVAVKQLPGEKSKKVVRKDLVIWEHDNQTVWSADQKPINSPLAIIEWKVNSVMNCNYDIDWLTRYTEAYPSVLGYSVCAHIKKNRSVQFKKIKGGKVIT